MALTPDDISEEYIASSRALAVTGTHLSHANTRAAVLKALEYARRHGLRTALDIDYRPVLWGSPRSAMAKPVSLSPDRSPASCRKCCICSIWWLEPKKSFILPGQHRYPDRAENVRNATKATRLQARADGLRGAGRRHPGQLGPVPLQQGVRVEVLNVLGAGDAFMSGSAARLAQRRRLGAGLPLRQRLRALVVSATAARRRCRPKSNSTTTCSAPNRCRARTSTSASTTCTGSPAAVSSGRSCAFSPLTIVNSWPIWRGRPGATKPAFRSSLLLAAAEAAAQEAGLDQRSGILADGTYGQRALNAITGKGWWIGRPIELPSSRPLRLEHGNIGSQLIDWPLEHVVKCPVFYHPDDPAALRAEQDALLLEVWQACNKSGHELLLEVILPENGPDKDERHYHTMLEHFYQLGIKPDWWKLPPLSSASWQQITALIEREDPWSRGILILGLDAPSDKLRAGFAEAAAHPMIKGFAVGRTIFGQPSRRWMQGELSDEALIEEVKRNYLTLIGYWREARR